MKHIALIATLLLALPVAVTAMPAHPEARVRIEPDQSVRSANTSSTAVVKVSVEAPAVVHSSRRSPVNVSIVLDRSGSMGGDKIEYARLAAIEAVRRLRPDDVFSLVTYDSEIETVIPAQNIRDLARIEAQIRAITPRGSTALYGGVNQGASELRKNKEGAYVHRILLLSDGIANVGPSSPTELEHLGRALALENIAVTTIGVGLGYNEDLMTRLARASDGNTYFVEASQDLPRILAAELGDVLNVFARSAVVRIEFDENIRPLAILGRDGTIRGRVVEIPFHQLYGGQERYALIEIELPEGKEGSTQPLGRAELTYEDVALRREVATRSAEAAIRYSLDESEVNASADPAIQAQILETRTAEARERAIELADQGRPDEAANQLRSLGSLYSDAADRFPSRPFARDAAALAAEAEAIEEHGIDNRQRKAYRASNHQIMNQQNAK